MPDHPPDPDFAAVSTDDLLGIARTVDGQLADDKTQFLLVVHNHKGTSSIGTLVDEHRNAVIAACLADWLNGKGADGGTYDAETLERIKLQ